MFLQKPMLGTQLDRSDSLNNPVLDLLMNEGHGDRVNDLSGHGNHGTLHGFDFPPTAASGWNPGLDGAALTFDGVDDYIDYGNNPSLDLTDAITGDALIKLSADFDTTANIFTFRSWKKRFQITNDRHIKCTLFFDGVQHTMIGNAVLPVDSYEHVIWKYDGANIAFYHNGMLDKVEAQTGAMDVFTDYPYNTIGVEDPTAPQWLLNGAIARARILPRAMSPFEVMQTQINPYGVYLQ